MGSAGAVAARSDPAAGVADGPITALWSTECSGGPESVNLKWPHPDGAGSSHRRNAGGCDRADGSGGQRITAAARSVGVVLVWWAQARVAAARARALP